MAIAPSEYTPSLPDFVRAAEAAFRGLPVESPLRGLIYEQFLDFVATNMVGERHLVALALAGSQDPEVRRMGEAMDERKAKVGTSLTRNTPTIQHLDLLVLTPKGNELSAALAAFGLSGPPTKRFGEDSDLWLWEANGLSLGLATIGTDGNVEAAIEMHRIASDIGVKAAVLVGMAAGLPGEVKKGDLVIASWVVAYEFARITKRRYVSRAKPYQADARSVQKVSQVGVSYSGWSESLVTEIRSASAFRGIERAEAEKLTQRWRPTVRTGVVFAGSRLIEDGSLRKLRERINDRGLAAEMEGAGFAAACSALRIPWMVIRGIADYGDQDVPEVTHGEGRRGKSWQFPSTFAAAAYVRENLISGRIPLIENARSEPR